MCVIYKVKGEVLLLKIKRFLFELLTIIEVDLKRRWNFDVEFRSRTFFAYTLTFSVLDFLLLLIILCDPLFILFKTSSNDHPDSYAFEVFLFLIFAFFYFFSGFLKRTEWKCNEKMLNDKVYKYFIFFSFIMFFVLTAYKLFAE